MRIAIANSSATLAGGVEKYLQALLPKLQIAGHELGFVCPIAAPLSRDSYLPAGVPIWSADGRTCKATVEEVASWRPDVVYSHGSSPELDAALASRFPTVYFTHNYGGTCISGNKCWSFPTVKPCTRRFGPACLALYLPLRCGGLNPVEMVRLHRRETRRREAFDLCRTVLTASRHMAAELVRNGVPSDRVRHVPLFPPGIDPMPNVPVNRPMTDRVLFIGRITALKGWRHLIDALPFAVKKLGRELTLVVAGEGPDRAAFEAEARTQNLRAEFLGWVGDIEREALMASTDLLLVPSVWPEPFGLVGIEAGCVGLPAVGFATGGIPDWLEPGQSGESAPGDRPNAGEFAVAIVRALSDPNHWHSLRVGAWETARRFSLKAHLDCLMPILEAAA